VKRRLPDSLITRGHPDFALLSDLSRDITLRAGGLDGLETEIPTMLRQCIDDVIMTPKTGRRAYEDLEKTEKTYIGTRVEIELRALLKLPRGRLDTCLLGHDVDIKHTMGSNWMIPTEAVDCPCLLVAADEGRALCYLGLIVARPAYLTKGQNKDAKRSISADGFRHILWLLRKHPYPPNFWRTVPADVVKRIFEEGTGNTRMAALFREVQGVPITRDVVEAGARQKDFMRRIRSDQGRGTRDLLAREGIVLLSGQYDTQLIRALNLPRCANGAFISHRPTSEIEINLIHQTGLTLS
jgi:restriction endonuclease NaeI